MDGSDARAVLAGLLVILGAAMILGTIVFDRRAAANARVTSPEA